MLTNCSSENRLQWVEEEGYRWAEVRPGFFGGAGFKQLSPSRTGINHRNDVEDEVVAQNRHYLNGSGVAAGDVTGNGFVDIYFANLRGPNKLYENLGNYRFRDITVEAGVAHEGHNSTGVVFADVNGNGSLDLIISSLSDGNALYINNGEGRFQLKEDSGLGESNGAHTLTLADINGNGLPDLYITNYKIQTARDIFSAAELSMNNTLERKGDELVVVPPFDQYLTIVETAGGSFQNEIGEADELYLNRGGGYFERADDTDYFFDENGNKRGLTPDWGLTAKFIDINGDQFPDLYVANDFWTPDRFWINQGDGTFRLIGTEAIRNMSFSSMGVDFSDINRNGDLDFVVTEMLSGDHSRRTRQSSEYLPEFEGRAMYSRNSVYNNRGDTTYAQIAWYSGLEASEWSWATGFLDVDLDGYEDLIVATGFGRDYQDMDTQIAMYERDTGAGTGNDGILDYPVLKLPNKLFKNNGDLTFHDVSKEWGFGAEDISLGFALADLNNTGTPDLIISRFNDDAVIYENRTNAPRIAVRLKGQGPNTQGIGATIELEGGPVYQSKQITAGGNYLSGSQAQVVFAAEEHSGHIITVTWPDGQKQVIDGGTYNRIYEIARPRGAPPANNQSASPVALNTRPALFKDASYLLAHNHHENEYDDFRFTPLLPLQLSRMGPGIAWLDITGNGYDDLLITSGKDGNLDVFENRGDGDFHPLQIPGLTDEAPGDQPSITGWGEDGRMRIAVGNANYEQGNPNVPSAIIYSIGSDGTVETDQIPGILSTTGPVVAADYTGNGYPDLFIGGRHIPGQYPVAADSRLFKNENGAFVLDVENSAILTGAGLVTDALFADFTGNGYQDLLLSTEWGTLRLFENRHGTFREITRSAGLANYKGWWNGLAAGDFTNNGLPDIIALNIGLNSAYQIRNGHPLRLYFDDFNWNGRLDILESYYSEEHSAWVPRRKFHDFESVPTILRNVSSHREFASASIEKIFDQDFSDVPYKEINTLEHLVFINTGNGFEAKPLPAKAQFSSAFYAGIADVDNDGNEDLFISQNFFGFPPATPRLDAGRGLVMKGDGQGNFEVVKGAESGIRMYGEQRGAALGDINRDGKVDLVVSQNNGPTKMFLNQAEKKGIRVQLEGPGSNKMALGSSLRLVYQDGSKGPRRYVLAGNGYGSQNSSVQVMGANQPPVAVEVHWFDGRVETVETGDDDIILIKSE